mmetsp:Transcript_28875/g.73708  ORF Transcript_28875/g.73708 Transcript_28875/m.73708 type:complete len:344 (-) Transcript_28875:388-1419(-)
MHQLPSPLCTPQAKLPCCRRHNAHAHPAAPRACRPYGLCLVLAGHGGVGDAADGARAAHAANKVRHAVALLDQLVLGGGQLGAQPVVQDEVVADLVVAVALGAAGEGEDEAVLHAVRVAVGHDGGGEAVAGRGGHHQGADGVSDGHRGGGGGGLAPLLDERATAGGHGGGELLLEPLVVADDVDGGQAADLGVQEIGHLGGGVVAPDGHAAHARVELAGLERQLALGAVLVQAGQRVEVLAGDVGRVLHGNQGVGVAGVAHHQHLAVAVSGLVQGTALDLEDLAVLVQQVGALHAGAAGLGAHHQRPLSASKHLHGVDANGHLAQQGVQGVLQLHSHTLQSTN